MLSEDDNPQDHHHHHRHRHLHEHRQRRRPNQNERVEKDVADDDHHHHHRHHANAFLATTVTPATAIIGTITPRHSGADRRLVLYSSSSSISSLSDDPMLSPPLTTAAFLETLPFADALITQTPDNNNHNSRNNNDMRGCIDPGIVSTERHQSSSSSLGKLLSPLMNTSPTCVGDLPTEMMEPIICGTTITAITSSSSRDEDSSSVQRRVTVIVQEDAEGREKEMFLPFSPPQPAAAATKAAAAMTSYSTSGDGCLTAKNHRHHHVDTAGAPSSLAPTSTDLVQPNDESSEAVPTVPNPNSSSSNLRLSLQRQDSVQSLEDFIATNMLPFEASSTTTNNISGDLEIHSDGDWGDMETPFPSPESESASSTNATDETSTSFSLSSSSSPQSSAPTKATAAATATAATTSTINTPHEEKNINKGSTSSSSSDYEMKSSSEDENNSSSSTSTSFEGSYASVDMVEDYPQPVSDLSLSQTESMSLSHHSIPEGSSSSSIPQSPITKNKNNTNASTWTFSSPLTPRSVYAISPASTRGSISSVASSLIGQNLINSSRNLMLDDENGEDESSLGYSETELSFTNRLSTSSSSSGWTNANRACNDILLRKSSCEPSISSHTNTNTTTTNNNNNNNNSSSSFQQQQQQGEGEEEGSIHIVTTTRRRASMGSSSSSSVASSSLSSKSRSRSKHSHKKPRHGSYNGVMLKLVDQMHGSGGTSISALDNSQSTLASYRSNDSSQRKQKNRVSVFSASLRLLDIASNREGGVTREHTPEHHQRRGGGRPEPLMRSLDYVSSTSTAGSVTRRRSMLSSSSNRNDDDSTSDKKERKIRDKDTHAYRQMMDLAKKSPKRSSRRRSSMGSGSVSGSSSVSSESTTRSPDGKTSKSKSKSPMRPPKKAPRQGSMGSASSESTARSRSSERQSKSKSPMRPPKKAPRRGSMGSVSVSSESTTCSFDRKSNSKSKSPVRHGKKSRTRRDSTSSSVYSESSRGKQQKATSTKSPTRSPSTTRRSLGLLQSLRDGSAQQQSFERRGSGYFSADSMEKDESGSFTSVASNMSAVETKALMEKLDGTGLLSSPRLVRSASPVRTQRLLKLDDLAQMRNSAPPRFDGFRSRRRIIRLNQKQDLDNSIRLRQEQDFDNSFSQRSSITLGQRLSISRLVDQLSIDNLEELNASDSSDLPPLAPHSPSTSRRSKPSIQRDGRPPIDQKSRTVRSGNRSIDLAPDKYNAIPKSRPPTSSPWQKRRHSVGSGSSNSVSTAASSSTDEDPRVRYSLDSLRFDYEDYTEDNMSVHSGATADPPRPSYKMTSDRSLSSHSSSTMSSISQASVKSKASQSSSDSSGFMELKPLTRIDSSNILMGVKPLTRIDSLTSGKTSTSEASYTLGAFKLVIPGSPVVDPKMMRKSCWQEDSTEMEARSSAWSEASSEDDSFARHARSVDLALTSTSSRSDRVTRPVRAVSPPRLLAVPSLVEMVVERKPSPIWKKLQIEKDRQNKLRTRLQAAIKQR